MTHHPNAICTTQMARNVSMVDVGFLKTGQYLLHERDSKFAAADRRLVTDRSSVIHDPPIAKVVQCPAANWHCHLHRRRVVAVADAGSRGPRLELFHRLKLARDRPATAAGVEQRRRLR